MVLPPAKYHIRGDLEFPRIDDRFQMKRHTKTFFSTFQPQLMDFPAVGAKMGGGFPPYNGTGSFDHETGKREQYFAGPRTLTQELVFCPRSKDAPEGDGWLIFLHNNLDTMSSELAIVDSNDFSKARAIIKLPIRLRTGLHGNWVDDADVWQKEEKADKLSAKI